jgi:hypothetical protein
MKPEKPVQKSEARRPELVDSKPTKYKILDTNRKTKRFTLLKSE